MLSKWGSRPARKSSFRNNSCLVQGRRPGNRVLRRRLLPAGPALLGMSVCRPGLVTFGSPPAKQDEPLRDVRADTRPHDAPGVLALSSCGRNTKLRVKKQQSLVLC